MHFVLVNPSPLDLEALTDKDLTSLEACAVLSFEDYEEEISSTKFNKTEFLNMKKIIEIGLSTKDASTFKYINPEILSKYTFYEHNILEMMERIDPLRNQTYRERRNLSLYLLGYWIKFLNSKNPYFIYFASPPHDIADYSLYIVSKLLGIPTHTLHENNLFKVRELSDSIDNVWKTSVPLERNNLIRNSNLTNQLLELFIKAEKLAAPKWDNQAYESTIIRFRSLTNSLFRLSKNLAKEVFLTFRFFSQTFFKLKNNEIRTRFLISKMLEVRKFLDYEISMLVLKIIASYEFASTLQRSDKKKLIFFLNFQPENTSCPLGGFFTNQHLAVSLISNYLPPEMDILIREHPAQRNPSVPYRYIGRDYLYYERMKSIGDIHFLTMKSNQFELIKESSVVATISGTVAWEAVLMGKPVLFFGNVWYQDCPGVYLIKTTEDLKEFFANLANFTPISRDELENYILKKVSEGMEIEFSEESCKAIGVDWEPEKFIHNIKILYAAFIKHYS